ncbi:MAG TPA: Crp/Fnr family transcriptional regulator [Candidatus Dormibacteraeota bacterium]|nr:Crp/Fnr family transcriptional regulator [Candidatus Dormibacteraeota bacterium]
MPGGSEISGNRLLARLPSRDRGRILQKLAPRFLKVRTHLFEAGEIVDSVYFPLDGVVSLVTVLEHGGAVEVATVGNEGLVGVPATLGGSLMVCAISQVAGRCLSMSIDAFFDELAASQPLTTLVNIYVQSLFGQISQGVACNRLHSTEERLSRWLLMSQDRVGGDQFSITREFLGQMLGVGRDTASLAANALERAGLVTCRPGHIEVADRSGLEQVSCECYRVFRSEQRAVTDERTDRPQPLFAIRRSDEAPATGGR